ncbi:protein phosphatase 2C domain-containing protein [Bradyrhizobium sp. 41S5]|uniref:protein phosphatase 2C domain-containing protein n=1 Tax=Bradyrhizobium sp. 41S5 TaxID=1404443 RepID=UPI00156A7B06|nr:protein phosphatase 2C domain-containing protein [Bradyrhizobium sp. 41S5]UFX42154.1 protein phosphatase 2C domain-containing protein [Bradyrhizobium sp. 41S5]
MRFTADHAFHIGSQHLRGGMPCQDYALSAAPESGAYAIVCDGCSTGGHTDVGARIVAHSTAVFLADYAGSRAPLPIDAACFTNDKNARLDLGLSQEDMLATCLYAKAYPELPGIHLRMVGDGVVAYRSQSGAIWMARLDWAKNMPLYRAYLEDSNISFCKAHADSDPATTLTCHRRDGQRQIEHRDWDFAHSLRRSIGGQEFYLNSEDTGGLVDVAVLSDGVTQVDGMDWRDVVAELMSFKSTEGAFVKRRMLRFLKDCQAHGKGPLDDIAMACIHIDHEAE